MELCTDPRHAKHFDTRGAALAAAITIKTRRQIKVTEEAPWLVYIYEARHPDVYIKEYP